MKKHRFKKINFGISFQLFTIAYLSLFLVALVSSPTTAFFQTESETLEGNILAADPFAGYAHDKVSQEDEDETNEGVAENESDDVDKSVEEDKVEENEKDENEDEAEVSDKDENEEEDSDTPVDG